MSRIMGDALVGGPEATSAPEVVTVRLTRGQAEALARSAEHMKEFLENGGHDEQSWYMSTALSALRTQIGGSR